MGVKTLQGCHDVLTSKWGFCKSTQWNITKQVHGLIVLLPFIFFTFSNHHRIIKRCSSEGLMMQWVNTPVTFICGMPAFKSSYSLRVKSVWIGDQPIDEQHILFILTWHSPVCHLFWFLTPPIHLAAGLPRAVSLIMSSQLPGLGCAEGCERLLDQRIAMVTWMQYNRGNSEIIEPGFVLFSDWKTQNWFAEVAVQDMNGVQWFFKVT